jgi:hypothetical protein
MSKQMKEDLIHLFETVSSWRDIEPVIQQFAIDNNLIILDHETLKKPVLLGSMTNDKFGELNGSEITDAGWRGKSEKNKNDCLIHSIFSCLSPTFRRLKDDYERNKIAALFRRAVLIYLTEQGLNYIPIYDPDNPKTEDPIEFLEGTDLLDDQLGIILSREFKINILWAQRHEFVDRDGIHTVISADFTNNNTSGQLLPTICIYGNGYHYQPVKLTPDEYMLDGFDGETFINTHWSPVGDRICDYTDGDIVYYNGKSYIVDGRDYDFTQTPSPCITIRLIEKPEDSGKPDLFIDASVEFVSREPRESTNVHESIEPATSRSRHSDDADFSPRGGRKTKRRRKRTTKKCKKRHDRKSLKNKPRKI